MDTKVVKEKYESRWNFMADRAGVPRESSKEDPEDHFQIMGRFEGEWESELSALFEKYGMGRAFNFLNKMGTTPEGVNIQPYTYELDKYDMENVLGISEESTFVSKLTRKELIESRELCPNIWKMVDWFGFTGNVLVKIHVQQPGQVFPYHFDDLTATRDNSDDSKHVDINPDKYARIEVQLFDWDYGQVWGVGNKYWSRWKAGEIMWHDWYTVPHGTANAGLKPRICLQITGEVNDDLHGRLRKDNGVIKL